MKISETIHRLRVLQAKIGDVELFMEDNDGRSTSAVPFRPAIEYKEIWPKHSAGKKYFIQNGYYGYD